MNKIEQMLQELCPEGVEYKKLGEVCEFQRGNTITAKEAVEGDVPVVAGGQRPAYYHNIANRQGKTVVVAGSGAYAGFVTYWEIPIFVSDAFSVNPNGCLDAKYLYYYLKNIQEKIHATKKGSGVPHVHGSSIAKFEIPAPPLPIQEEIVRILDHFTELTASLQAELQARQEQYEYYRNKLLSFGDDIPEMKLNNVVTFMNGKGHEKYIEDKGAYIVVNSKFISSDGKVIKYSNSQISPVYENMILMVMSDLPNGKALAKCFIVDADNKYTLNQRIGAFTIRDKNLINTRFLYYILNRNKLLLSYDNGVDQTNLRKGDILNIVIPIPPLSEQQRIVSILDKFDALVNDLSQGLPAEIAAVQEQYEYYRNKLLTFNHIKSN